jgi:hypothetical protein
MAEETGGQKFGKWIAEHAPGARCPMCGSSPSVPEDSKAPSAWSFLGVLQGPVSVAVVACYGCGYLMQFDAVRAGLVEAAKPPPVPQGYGVPPQGMPPGYGMPGAMPQGYPAGYGQPGYGMPGTMPGGLPAGLPPGYVPSAMMPQGGAPGAPGMPGTGMPGMPPGFGVPGYPGGMPPGFNGMGGGGM